MTLGDLLDQWEAAANAFALGRPDEVKALFAHDADVVLANPFGPAVHGWDGVSAMLDYASSRFSDGDVTEFKIIARYECEHFAVHHGTEHWRARVGGADAISDFDLRVTTTYRNTDGNWAIVHRHADPISTASDVGPLRTR